MQPKRSAAEGNPGTSFPAWAWVLAGAVLVLDQASKLLVQHLIRPLETVAVIPDFFRLVHVLNKGAAFGFLNRPDMQWQAYFFICVTLVAVGIIVYLLHSSERRDRFFLLGLGAILGGALGNLVDRVRMGMVIDFLDFSIGSFHWPAFNVADCAITVGALSLLASFYRRERHASGTH